MYAAAVIRGWWVAAVVAAVVAPMLALNLYLTTNTVLQPGWRDYADYSALYLAGRMVSDGQAHYLYSYGAQLAYQRQVLHVAHSTVPFNHPAYEALLFTPLAQLPYEASFSVWALINVLFLFALAQLLQPHLPRGLPAPALLVFAVALAFAPVGIALAQGQDSILQLLFLALAFVELKRRRDRLAGCWLAMALIKWHLVLPAVAVLLLQRRWRVAHGFALGAFALLLVSLAVIGWSGAGAYADLLRYTAGQLDIAVAMTTLRGFFALWVQNPALLRWVTIAASLALFLLPATAPGGDARGRELNLDFALAITISLLVGYHVYIHDLTLLLLPLLLFAGLLVAQKRIALLAASAGFLFIQVFVYFTGGRYLAWLTVPVLALALLIWRERRRISLASPTESLSPLV